MTLTSEDASAPGSVPPVTSAASRRNALVAVAGFFAFKAGIGALILALSANRLSVIEFATFSQLFLYLALLGSVAAAGVQNGVIREVASAHGDLRRERSFVLGSLAIWAGFAAIVAIIAITLHDRISIILVGNRSVAGIVALLTVTTLVAGLGTLLCSALSGSGRAPRSLAIQGFGLLIGGGLCLARLQAGDAEGAVVAYAAGPLCTTGIALWTVRHWLVPGDLSWSEIRTVARSLLSYASTFLIVASALPLVLFGTRYVYRIEFGTVWLGYWLMANRVSDVSTQVVGLYLSQVFLPQVTRSIPGAERLRKIRYTLILGVTVSGAGAAVFALGSRQIISLVLSERYIAALPFIMGYLVGDMFRVGGNVALYTVLAARRLKLFVAIEVGLAILVAIAILAGIAAGYPTSAYWGYLTAHAIAFLAVLLLAPRLARL